MGLWNQEDCRHNFNWKFLDPQIFFSDLGPQSYYTFPGEY